jgi:hypothetical protein
MTICQVLNCKNEESRTDYDTLCKKHAKIIGKKNLNPYDQKWGNPLKYKTINEKNKVWENGHECIRSIPTPMINDWIRRKTQKIVSVEETINILNDQLVKLNEELTDLLKTKNMRFVK